MIDIPEDWERFEKVNTRAASMTASIYKGNKLSLTKAVQDVLGTQYIELLYNKSRNLIGIISSNEDSSNAYKLKQPKRQTSWSVGISAFLRYYDLEKYQSKKFKVLKENNLLIIDLNEELK